jgi:hypothetical protein
LHFGFVPGSGDFFGLLLKIGVNLTVAAFGLKYKMPFT